MPTRIISREIVAPPAQPQQPDGSKTPTPSVVPSANGGEGKVFRAVSPAKDVKLSPRERVCAVLTLFVWINLFAGGMMIDTQPYRCTISWNGVKAVDSESPRPHPCSAYWSVDQKIGEKVFNRNVFSGRFGASIQPLVSWTIAILFFIPLNLAFIAAAAGALGSLGNIANLNPDPRPDGAAYDNPEPKAAPGFALKSRADAEAELYGSRDNTNPYISGLLRGMFAYLFVISGMLLFDDAPFDAPSPGQYIRLAGFLSLFSFIVNYQPSVFRSMLDGAQKLISTKGRGPAADDTAARRMDELIQAVRQMQSTQVAAEHQAERQKVTVPTSEGSIEIVTTKEEGRVDVSGDANAQGRTPADADGSPRKDNLNGNGRGGELK